MILNQPQQNKLLGIANGRGAGTGETITLRVKGKDLEAVLGQNQIMRGRL